jgi:hypothetical protein
MNSIQEHHDYRRSESNGNGNGETSCHQEHNMDATALAAGPICTCGRMSSSDMMMTVAIDNEKTKPANSSGIGNTSRQPSENTNGGGTKTNSVWLESSFVHLMTPRNNHIRTTKEYEENGSNTMQHQLSSAASPSQNDEHPSQHGFLERHQHMLKLLEAAYTHVDESIEHNSSNCSNNFNGKPTKNTNNDPNRTAVELCVDCIDRVALTLEAETQRLYAEVDVYGETVQASKQRSKALQRTTIHLTHATTAEPTNSSHNQNDKAAVNNNNPIEEAYQEEIAMLEREIQARSDELLHYKSIHKEQTELTAELGTLEEGLQSQENSLELQSEAFDNRRQILTKSLAEVQHEVDKLTCVSLPRVLFDLQVDQARGLHYPLINQLRLAFRPKGDVPAQEIQVAWSQATQLLLILGTLLEYPGLDWKLVPLADCAKLIYRKEIFNLVPGDCRSLMAWNALLDQVVKHALSLVAGVGVGGCGTAGNNRLNSNKQHSQQYDNTNRMTHNHSRNHNTSTRCTSNNANINANNNDPTTVLFGKPTLPPYSSSPTMIGNTELARLDPIDHVVWSQVIHRMASNLLWLSNRASSLSATQVSSLAHCVV